jgi:uncharacterized membrane protein (DUF106 family)
MLEWLNNFCLQIMDPIGGWMLGLPMNVALFILAIGTSFILTVVRLFTTNQDLLRRCREDKKRLKQVIKDAKQRKDKETVKRLRGVMGMIGIKTMKSEGKPLLAALLPIAVLGTWAFQRFEFHPPKAGEEVQILAYLPKSQEGQLIHIVPQDGVTSDGWVKEVTLQKDVPVEIADGEAVWKIKAEARPQPYELEIRYKDKTYKHPLLVGQKKYETALVPFEKAPVMMTQTKMEQVKLFGVVPGIPPLKEDRFMPSWLVSEAQFMPPWLTAYLIIAIIFVFVLKPVLKIE